MLVPIRLWSIWRSFSAVLLSSRAKDTRGFLATSSVKRSKAEESLSRNAPLQWMCLEKGTDSSRVKIPWFESRRARDESGWPSTTNPHLTVPSELTHHQAVMFLGYNSQLILFLSSHTPSRMLRSLLKSQYNKRSPSIDLKYFGGLVAPSWFWVQFPLPCHCMKHDLRWSLCGVLFLQQGLR